MLVGMPCAAQRCCTIIRALHDKAIDSHANSRNRNQRWLENFGLTDFPKSKNRFYRKHKVEPTEKFFSKDVRETKRAGRA